MQYIRTFTRGYCPCSSFTDSLMHGSGDYMTSDSMPVLDYNTCLYRNLIYHVDYLSIVIDVSAIFVERTTFLDPSKLV
jgi:hypothetical protein